MPFYQDLGRHTPPPPPYSQDQGNSNSIILAYDASQQSDPPPPPPYLSSTSKTESPIPSFHELEQTMPPTESNLCHNGNDKPLPLVSYQVSGAQTPGLGQGFGDYPRRQYCESIRFGIPVEPEVIPGIRAHPLRPFDKLPLESSSQSVPHQTIVYNHSLAPNMASLNASFVTQPPSHASAKRDQQSLPMFRRHSSTNSLSLTNTTTYDAPASLYSFGLTPPLFALPSQLGGERRVTLPVVSTSQELNTAGRVADVKTLPEPKAICSRHENPNDSYGIYTRATTLPDERHRASPARLVAPSRDCASQGSEKRRLGPQVSHRRPSASVRFDPYKRRQSKVPEETEKKPEGVSDGEHGRSQQQVDSDVEMEEGEEGVEMSR